MPPPAGLQPERYAFESSSSSAATPLTAQSDRLGAVPDRHPDGVRAGLVSSTADSGVELDTSVNDRSAPSLSLPSVHEVASDSGVTTLDIVNSTESGSRRSNRDKRARKVTNVGELGDIGSDALRRMSEVDEFERVAYLSAAPILEQATDDNDRDPRWLAAKVKEMYSLLIENNCWNVVPLPKDANAVTTRWLCRHKTHPVPKDKARFLARGYSQIYGVDYKETYAPVAKLSTLRIFLTLVIILSLVTAQIDLKTAFLNASLEEEIYLRPVYDMCYILKALLKTLSDDKLKRLVIEQLKGLNKGYVLKLNKAIYGLKQAPREWWKELLTFLLGLGFVTNAVDPCLLIWYIDSSHFVILLLYVDDILIAASNQKLLDTVLSKLRSKFRVSSEGVIDNYLGITINIASDLKSVRLNMEDYVVQMCKRFKVAVKQSVNTPMEENFQAALENSTPADEVFVKDFQYREKIGCLMYFMICMCPQICYAVGLLARQTNKVSKTACTAVTRLLQFCYNIKDKCLRLGGTSSYITAFADSDWAGDRATRCSTGGWIIYLGSGCIEWGSKLFTLPAQSVAEAEYLAMLEPCKSILSLRWLFKDTGIPQLITQYSSTLFGDNISSQTIAQNPVCSKRTKYIALKYHMVRKLYACGVIYLERVDTHSNVADMLTKSLGKRKFEKFAPQAWGEEEFVRATKMIRTEVSDESV